MAPWSSFIHLYNNYTTRCNCGTHVMPYTKLAVQHNTKVLECLLQNKCMTADEYKKTSDTSGLIAFSTVMTPFEKKRANTVLKEQRITHFLTHGCFENDAT